MDWLLEKLGLKKLLPQGQVIGPMQRSRVWFAEAESGVEYVDQAPMCGPPVLPLIPFGLTYDLDIVLVTEHPDWNMHEYAMVRTPDGPAWLMKDAREPDLTQTIVADIEDIHGWMPEVPIKRKRYPVEVEDRSTTERVDVSLAYENMAGESVEVHYEGGTPFTPETRRNGSTMGHSRSQLMALVDLSHKEFGKRAEVRIGGQGYKISRILGLVPFRMALQQTQGGLCVGEFGIVDVDGDSFETVHGAVGEGGEPGEARQTWVVERRGGRVEVWQRGSLRSIVYRFIEGERERLELVSISVFQWGRATPTFNVEFAPALPDLRVPFGGSASSRFVVDVNGQQNMAVGRIKVHWHEQGPHLTMRPAAPWWTTDRPMDTRVTFDGAGGARVEIARVEVGDPGCE